LKDKYKKYLDNKKLEEDFNRLIERKAIVKPDINPCTELYFFQSSLTKPKLVDNNTEKCGGKYENRKYSR
jgi:hypothetical protein